MSAAGDGKVAVYLGASQPVCGTHTAMVRARDANSGGAGGEGYPAGPLGLSIA